MYAPRQFRQEKKKPAANFLALEGQESQGPIQAPPAYSADSPASEVGTQEKESSSNAVVQNKLGRSENPPQFKLKAGGPMQMQRFGAPMQMKAANGAAAASGGASAAGNESVMGKMEKALNADFKDVNIVENSSKASEAGALAFAQGNEVHFAPGQFSPETPGGQQLLGHELTHVVQQRQGRVQATGQIGDMAVNDDHALEAEADHMGNMAASMQVASASPITSGGGGGGGFGAAQMKLNPDGEKIKKEEKGKKSEQPEMEQPGELHLAFEGKTQAEEDVAPAEKEEFVEGAENEALAFGGKLQDQENPETENAEGNETENTEKGNEHAESGDGLANEGPESEGQETADQASAEAEQPTDAAQDAEASREDKATEEAAKENDADSKEGKETKGKVEKEAGAQDVASGDESAAPATEGAGAGGGVETSAGGGGGGAAAGGGAGGDAGVVPPQLEPINVMPAQMGSFGEDEEPNLLLVNEAALKDFSSDSILNKNADGSAIVLGGAIAASAGPSGDAAIQRVPDPKKTVPLKKAVSKEQSKSMLAPNRERAKAYLSEYEAAANAKIAGLESAKGGVAAKLAAGAAAAKSTILSAAAAEKARVQSEFAAIKSALQADAERIKGETRAAAEASKAAVLASAQTAKANLEAEFQAQDAAFVALEPEMKAKFTAAFVKGRQDMIDAATEVGQKGVELGEKRAAEYDAMPTPEQSWDEDLLNGGDYEKNRHKARVEAAKSTGTGFKDGLLKSANEEADKMKGSGEAELHNYVTSSVAQSRQAIAQRKQAAQASIDANAQGAISSITANCDSTTAGIDAATTSGIAALDSQQVQAVGQIDTTAQGKVQAVDATAQEKTVNIGAQLDSAISALHSQVNQTVTKVSARKNPNAESIRAQLQSAQASVDAGVAKGMTLISGGAEASAAGMADTATQTAAELNSAASAQIQGAQGTKESMVANLESQREGFVTAAKGIETSAMQSMTQEAETAVADMKSQYDAVKADFDKAHSALEGKLGENSAGFKTNVETKYSELNAIITTKAQEAYDAVQPRWCSWLLTAIDIIVVILVTAVICLAVASGVGILGVLLIGAVAGAVGGAIKYGARVGLTSEEFDIKKLGNEMIAGAVDGVNIAAGMTGLGPLAVIGIGALGGAVKYGGDVLLGGEEFSWGALAGKTFLGALEGAIGLIGGKAGDGVGNYLTKKLGGEAIESLGKKILIDVGKTGTEAFFDTVGGGLQNMGEHFIKTGTMDFGKFTEKFTLEEFATNFATSKVTDVGAAKVTSVGKSVLNIPDAPSTSGATTTTAPDTTPAKNDADTLPAKDNSSTETPTNTDVNNPVNTVTPLVNGDSNNPVNQNDTNAPVNQDSNAPINNEGVVNPAAKKNDGDNTSNKDTDAPTNKPQTDTDAPTHKGQQQADALGYPKAPDGYTWVAKADGQPYLRRDSGRKADLPPVKFDPTTNQFKPDIPAPGGYHWQMVDGKFSLHPDPNLADSLPPIQYDPTTEGFKTADGQPFTGDLSSTTVRGQDLAGFTSTIKGLEGDPITAKQAYDLYAKKDWAALEKLFNEKGLNEGWPPNRGFIDRTPGTLEVGAKFDRFGGYIDKNGDFQDKGTFVADYGSDFDGRALPDKTKESPLNGYEVVKPIPMIEGSAIPWFGKPGGGKQYELGMTINDLKAGGYIKLIDAPNLDAPKTDGTTNTTTPKVDGGDGGGMKGKDVYPVAPDGQKISDLDPAKVNEAVVDTVMNSGVLPEGSALTHGDNGTLNMSIHNGESNPPIVATVTINKDFNPDGGSTSHGTDQGAAINKITVNADGTITVEIGLSGNHNQADINKMVAHEFHEVADILKQVEAHKKDNPDATPESIDALIKQQQEASMFKEGGSLDPNDMTAHDRAVVKELNSSLAELHQAIVEGGEIPSSKVLRLLDSMGIELASDPRLQLLKDSLGLDSTPEVDAWLSQHIGAVRGDLDFSTMGIANAIAHVNTRDMGADRKKGIVGCHNKTEWALVRQVDLTANPAQRPVAGLSPSDVPEVYITSERAFGTVPGVSIVVYQIPSIDRTGKTDGNFKAETFEKTIYDPAVWPDAKLEVALQEAAEYAARKNGGIVPTKFVGLTKEGYIIEGWFRNGKIDTFYFK